MYQSSARPDKRRLQRMLLANNGSASRLPGETLNWRFSAGNGLPPGMSVVRAGTNASFLNSSGVLATASANQIREAFQYVNGVLVPRGSVVEAAATNICPYSNVLSSWVDAASCGAVQNATGLDGTTSAWTLTRSDGVNEFRSVTPTCVIGSTYTLSAHVEKLASTAVPFPLVGLWNQGYEYWALNQITGAATKVYDDRAGGNTTCTVTQVGLTRWRIAITWTQLVDTFPQIILLPAMSPDGTSFSYTTGGSNVFERVQVELGAHPTSYIDNAGVGTTARNADVLTGTASNFLDNTKGFSAIQFEAIAPNIGSQVCYLATYDAITGYWIPIYRSNTSRLYTFDGATFVDIAPLAETVGGVYSLSTTWNGSTQTGAVNGVLGSSGAFTSPAIMGPTLRVGDIVGGGSQPVAMYLKALRMAKQPVNPTRLASPFT